MRPAAGGATTLSVGFSIAPLTRTSTRTACPLRFQACRLPLARALVPDTRTGDRHRHTAGLHLGATCAAPLATDRQGHRRERHPTHRGLPPLPLPMPMRRLPRETTAARGKKPTLPARVCGLRASGERRRGPARGRGTGGIGVGDAHALQQRGGVAARGARRGRPRAQRDARDGRARRRRRGRGLRAGAAGATPQRAINRLHSTQQPKHWRGDARSWGAGRRPGRSACLGDTRWPLSESPRAPPRLQGGPCPLRARKISGPALVLPAGRARAARVRRAATTVAVRAARP